MKHILCLFLAAVTITGCNPNKGKVIFEEHQELSPNVEWKKADKRTFTVDITDNSAPVEWSIAFRYASGFYYAGIPLRITETSPNGSKTILDVDVMVRDEKGEFIGEKGFDIIDMEQVIDPNKQYPTHGRYTYTIEHMMADSTVDFCMEIGMVIRKKPAEKK